MSALDVISYGANIVFITYGCTAFIKDKKRNKDNANYLNGGYEMAKRLSEKSQPNDTGQSKDVMSFLLSATMNAMDLERNEIGRKKKKFWQRFFCVEDKNNRVTKKEG